MEASGDTWVFWILGPVFLGVGVWLFVYGGRRSAMIRRFARRHGLSYEARAPDSLAEELTETFRLREPKFARAFMLIRDLSGDGRVHLFKCMELLDLNPWGRARPRITRGPPSSFRSTLAMRTGRSTGPTGAG